MPSDAALLLADLVEDPKAFPDEAVDALQTLLGDRLVRLDPGAHRWDLLHALVTLIRESNGTAPTAAQYEAARQERFPEAPAASTLAERFGTWLKAIDAASRLPRLSNTNPVWTQEQPARTPYTPVEIAAALAQFRATWGDWPRPSEYRLWACATRRAKNRCGAPDPRLPAIAVIYKRFGRSFNTAVAYARSIYEDHGELAE